MGVPEIKPGQIWRSDDGGEEWLVTKSYRELLDLYVILRKPGGPEEDLRRVKVQRDGGGFRLPGFALVGD